MNFSAEFFFHVCVSWTTCKTAEVVGDFGGFSEHFAASDLEVNSLRRPLLGQQSAVMLHSCSPPAADINYISVTGALAAGITDSQEAFRKIFSFILRICGSKVLRLLFITWNFTGYTLSLIWLQSVKFNVIMLEAHISLHWYFELD